MNPKIVVEDENDSKMVYAVYEEPARKVYLFSCNDEVWHSLRKYFMPSGIPNIEDGAAFNVSKDKFDSCIEVAKNHPNFVAECRDIVDTCIRELWHNPDMLLRSLHGIPVIVMATINDAIKKEKDG